MRVTGKRHDVKLVYKAGFDQTGRINALIIDQYLRCGMSYDLSKAIAVRAMTHAENAYHIPHASITAILCRHIHHQIQPSAALAARKG